MCLDFNSSGAKKSAEPRCMVLKRMVLSLPPQLEPSTKSPCFREMVITQPIVLHLLPYCWLFILHFSPYEFSLGPSVTFQYGIICLFCKQLPLPWIRKKRFNAAVSQHSVTFIFMIIITSTSIISIIDIVVHWCEQRGIFLGQMCCSELVEYSNTICFVVFCCQEDPFLTHSTTRFLNW